jgi:phosphoglycolate phosphatase-like HAD superfamily hydrolase
MIHTRKDIETLKPARDFFVGIDSDGCAFPTMEVKHKECFIPNTVKHWKLQPVSRFAREAAEFVNLYSKWRGINRFPALIMVFDLLAERPEVTRAVKLPDIESLRSWTKRETTLGNATLKTEITRSGDPLLKRVLAWSEGVNASVEDMVVGVPPFPGVKESLERLSGSADIMVVSATPGDALEREWKEHGIDRYVRIIAGQELGSKKEHLQMAAGGKYGKDHVLMIGDAPGDMAAARANGALFLPINPGSEEESWQRFFEEGMDRFLRGTFAGAYEKRLVEDFEKLLPDTPPWKKHA